VPKVLMTKEKINPDHRGRVSLGNLVTHEYQYNAEKLDDGTVILKPYVQVQVPPKEAWLFKNSDALSSVKAGIKQSKEGNVKKRKSYAEFVDIEID